MKVNRRKSIPSAVRTFHRSQLVLGLGCAFVALSALSLVIRSLGFAALAGFVGTLGLVLAGVAGVVSFVLLGYAVALINEEAARGYTTTRQRFQELEQRNPYTGEVIRGAGEPFLDDAQYRKAVGRSRSKRNKWRRLFRR